MNKHKLLIMITTYERGYNLPAIVDSVINQTFKDYKIIICDDCSPNDPTEIIQGIKNKYPNVDIEHHRNYRNLGESLNIATNVGKEFDNDFKYLVLLQDDTIYLDNTFLSNGIDLLEQNPDALYCAGIRSIKGYYKKIIELPNNALALKLSGIDFWRRWPAICTFWGACIFRYDSFIKYRFSGSPRKDVHNGDSLLLLNIAMPGHIIFYNKLIMEISYNNNNERYQNSFKDPIDKFVKVEKYYKLASESAVQYGASKEEAANWLLSHQVGLALAAINRIGNNKELRRKFMITLNDYDTAISTSVLNTILDSVAFR